MFICQYCGSIRKSKKSLIAHEATCPKNLTGYRNIPWNKGKTKDSSESIKALSDKMTGRKRPEFSGQNHPYYGKLWGSAVTGHTDNTKKYLSEVATSRGFGGYVQGSGRGKKGWYKGFFCDSSWELAYVIYCLDHNMQIRRNTEQRQYVWEDKVRNYIPDFVVDGVLTEIKGYKTAQWLAKLAANQDVTVLYEQEMKPYLQYVVETYGKDYVSLYE